MKMFRMLIITLSLVVGWGTTTNFAQTYRVNDRQIRNLLNRIEQRTDTFKYQIDRSLDNGGLNNSQSENYINEVVLNFEASADSLKQNYSSGVNVSNNVRDLLNHASYIENFMRDYRFNSIAVSSWNQIKTDLSQLARYYNVAWNWNQNNYPTNNSLTGTYRLNPGRSDDINLVLDSSTGNSTGNDRRRENLQRRLAVPELLAIEKMNNMVTIASSNAARTTFDANGRVTSERLPNGRVMSTRVTSYRNKLEINTDGDRMNAFYLSFEPINNGERLRVTRRLNLENRNQTITVVSVYDRTSTVAQWNVYNNGTVPNTNAENFYIPNGTRLVATLNTNLSTRTTAEGEKFALTVSQPSAYQGAVIEGTVNKVQRSGRLTGRAELSLNFETIRLRNGSIYRFEGLIDRITTENGRTVSINNEDAIRSSSQTRDTVVRTGIGAAIGAVIGGIAGGGQGATIGAVIGAGAGGGSVLIQGRDDLELNYSSTFELTSSAPAATAFR